MALRWTQNSQMSFEAGVAIWETRGPHGAKAEILKTGPGDFFLEVMCSPDEDNVKVIHRSVHATLADAKKLADVIFDTSGLR